MASGSTFIMEPRILVLVTSAPRSSTRWAAREIFDIVKQLNADGVTVIMVDHDMERVARYADTVMVLERGEVVALGSPMEVFSDPAIEEHGVEVPDCVKITRALGGPIAITEEPAIHAWPREAPLMKIELQALEHAYPGRDKALDGWT